VKKRLTTARYLKDFSLPTSILVWWLVAALVVLGLMLYALGFGNPRG
jgi:hypothetical protein